MCTIFIDLLLVVLIVGLIDSFTHTVSANICNRHQNHDRIPDYTDCTKYFECLDGQHKHRACRKLEKFDTVLRKCSSEPVECFKCPSNPIWVDLPIDLECSQFIRCMNGKPTHHLCESDLLFDPIRRQCNNKKDVVCPCPCY